MLLCMLSYLPNNDNNDNVIKQETLGLMVTKNIQEVNLTIISL